jgi:uncharacterized membrane protein
MQDSEIAKYIKDAKEQGATKETIYLNLLSSGFSVETIEQGYKLIETENVKTDYQKRTISIIVIIGAILIGAGIFSFIASNWQEMSKPSKIFTIIFFMLVAYASGWFMREKYASPKTGHALFFLGSLIFGGGIFLIGQIFNISTNWPDAFVLWMLGSIILALAIDSYLIMGFSAVLGMIGVVSHFANIFDNFSGFGSSLFLILIAIVATLFVAITEKGKIPEKYKNIY